MTDNMIPALFDVIATKISPPHTRRILKTNMTLRNADAYVDMAVMRLGVKDEFFMSVQSGSVEEGSELD